MTLLAAGFLIFRRFTNQIEYLLLQTSYGQHHWTPPKGHVDPGESNEETALRETREESGLGADHLQVHYNFKRTLTYIANDKPKSVIYWLAELKDPNTPIVLSSEHQDYKWLELNDACRYVGYQDLQQVIKDSEAFIKTELYK